MRVVAHSCSTSPRRNTRVKESNLSKLAGAATKGGWHKCVTCLHKDRAAIEDAVVGGLSIAAVAKKFGLSSSALQRHMDRHGRTSLVKVTAGITPTTGESTSDELEALLQEAKARLASAGSASQGLDAIDKALKVVIARAAWEERRLMRQPAATVNLLTTAEWVEARTIFMRVTAAHDDKHGHVGSESIGLQLAAAFKEEP